MGGGPRDPRRLAQLGEGARPGLEGTEEGNGLVEDADSAYTLFH